MKPQRWASLTGLVSTILFASLTSANTEKAIFLAPLSPKATPSRLDSVHLEILQHPSASWATTLRTSLPVDFPTDDKPRGLDSWYLLDHLTEGQRYEVRVCWAANQPTAFDLEVFDLETIVESQGLLDSLIAFQQSIPNPRAEAKLAGRTSTGSVSLLRVQAAADYFSTNATLMRYPPPVLVDIILDPYWLNVFPQSLIPTAVYIVVLAIGGFFLSGIVSRQLISRAGITRKDHND